MLHLDELCKKVCELAREAGNYIAAQSGRLTTSDIETKGLHDLVTSVDKHSERMLVEGLTALLPGSGFITEENTVAEKAATYNWIIDPLDGTTNFIQGVPSYAVSIALAEKEKIILGVVYEVNAKECFYSIGDDQSFLNGKQIKVAEKTELHDSLIATGFPYNDYSRLREYLQVLSHLMQNTRGIRRIGSAATDLCYVACARFDAFFEYSLKPWDVAAGSFIAQHAGARVCDFRGGNDFIFGKEVIAGSPLITEQLLFHIQRFFN